MVPNCPALFSISTGCPRASPIFGLNRRATTSAAPPGGTVTMIRTGFTGNAWAWAHAGRIIAAMAAYIVHRWIGIGLFRVSVSDGRCASFRA